MSDGNIVGVVIDPGHGGIDTGATGNGIVEKELTLLISEYMENRFRELGVPVTMTRTSDTTLTPTERTNKIKNAYGDRDGVIVISNHINAGGGDGAEIIYALRNNNRLSNLVLNEISKTGQNARNAYQRRLPSNPSKDYYFIHRETGVNTEPIIVEYGFLDSTGDDVNQLKNNYEMYAEAVVKGVVDYLNLPYTLPSGNSQNNTYIVKPGDTLYGIAQQLNTSVAALKNTNNLNTNQISIGQILKVPQSGIVLPETDNNFVYLVKPGDTLYSIARMYTTSVDDIKALNNISEDNLLVGQTLLIPQTTSNIPITDDTQIIYTVKSGDSLWRIANTYGVSVNDLMMYNNLTSNLLSVGDIIKIPNQGETSTTYVVKSGDSLYSIARKYNTTVDEIKRKNNLTGNLLKIGEILQI